MAELTLRHLDAFAEALKSLALAGAGVAWLTESSVNKALTSGRLVPAGDEQWYADLTLSLFAAPARLDDSGLQIWSHFRSVSDQNQD